MNAQSHIAAADALIAARRTGARLVALPEAARPRTLVDAYAVQAAFRARWGAPPSGWKIGATAAPVQARFGVDAPFFGPFYSATTYASPAKVPAASLGLLALESEFAFRFAKTLGPRAERYDRDEILAAVDALIPAFEIVSPRFDRILFDSPFEAIADCGLNGAMVLGSPITTGWRTLDLAAHPVRLTVDGKPAGEGTGASVLGHPFNVLDWAVNALSAQGIALEAGHIVSTGTCTGVVMLEVGKAAVADFGGLGRVELRFV